MVNLLAGLEDDGYQMNRSKCLSQNTFSSRHSTMQNSDDEENEPQVEKEEMELSMLMSQRWDSNSEEHDAKRKYVCNRKNKCKSSLQHCLSL